MVAADLLDDAGLLDVGPAPPPAEPLSPGVCPLCRARPARQPCRACGQAVCADDLWVMLGLCRSCASDRDVARWHGRGRVDGRNWLEEAPG